MYLGIDYICLASLDLHNRARIFHVVQQQLRDYILAMPELLSYLTMSLTSVVYVEPMSNTSTHLYEELVTFLCNI